MTLYLAGSEDPDEMSHPMRHFISVNSVRQNKMRSTFILYVNHNVQTLSIYNGPFRVYRSQYLQNGSISVCELSIWQAVEIQMKCRILRHFMRITSACKVRTKRPPEESTTFL